MLSVILCGIALNSYYSIQKKDGLYVDEIFSFVSSNSKTFTFHDFVEFVETGDTSLLPPKDVIEPTEIIYSYDSLYNKCIVDNYDEKYNFFGVYIKQAFSDSHPPLYYFILHAISSLKERSNIYMIGYVVNVLFLSLVCLLIFFITKLLTNNSLLSLLAVSYYGFSYEFLNSINLFRMYPMLSCWFCLLTYYYLKFQKCNFHVKKKDLLFSHITLFLAFFTHHYTFIYFFPFYLITIYHMRKNKYEKLLYTISVLLAIFFYYLIWPYSILQVLKGWVLNISTPSIPLFTRCHASVNILIKELFAGKLSLFCLIILICMILCIVIAFKRKYKVKDLLNVCFKYFKRYIMLMPSLIFFIVVMTISPWNDWRYVSPVMPMISIIILLILYKLLSKVLECSFFTMGILGVLVVTISLYWVPKVPIRFAYERTPEKSEFISNNHNKQAIILDAYNNRVYWDVIYNYKHPRYLRTDDTCAVEFLSCNLCEDEYTLYVSKFSDINIVQEILDNNNYKLHKLNYNTEFFYSYNVKRQITD